MYLKANQLVIFCLGVGVLAHKWSKTATVSVKHKHRLCFFNNTLPYCIILCPTIAKLCRKISCYFGLVFGFCLRFLNELKTIMLLRSG